MHLADLKVLAILLPLLCVAAWVALKFWRDRAPSSKPVDPDVNVRAVLVDTRTRGWTFFNLVLLNRSRMRIAVIDATLSISNLTAKFQASPPIKQTTLKIRRIVKPGEALPMSLVEAFYEAAGKPQSAYEFVVAATVRYRAHGDLFEQPLPLYRVRMVALSPNTLQRLWWYNKPSAAEPLCALPDLEPADLKWLDAQTGPAASA